VRPSFGPAGRMGATFRWLHDGQAPDHAGGASIGHLVPRRRPFGHDQKLLRRFRGRCTKLGRRLRSDVSARGSMADLVTGHHMRRRWRDAAGPERWRNSTLLLLALGASACGAGALTPTTTLPWCEEGPSYGTETATVDGNAWTPVRVAAVGLIGAGPLEINASDCRRIFNIVFANNPGPGTYTLANGVTNVLLANEPGSAGDNLVLPSSPGFATVTLTEVSSTTISGTFEITIGPHVFTNGRFDVRY